EVKFADTVCQPTKERQQAAHRLAATCDVVVVVGGRNSNNTRQLVRACEAEGARVHHVETATELRPAWFDGAGTVGLTAGTSTPDEVIAEVHQALLGMATEGQPRLLRGIGNPSLTTASSGRPGPAPCASSGGRP